MSQLKTVTSVTTDQPIAYSFKRITYRQFRKAIEMLEDSRIGTREEKNRMVEDATRLLIEGADMLLDEATNGDVQAVVEAAIEYNQGSEVDAKKSE